MVKYLIISNQRFLINFTNQLSFLSTNNLFKYCKNAQSKSFLYLNQLSIHVLSENLKDVVAALVLGDGVEVAPLAAGVVIEPVAWVHAFVHVASHKVAL